MSDEKFIYNPFSDIDPENFPINRFGKKIDQGKRGGEACIDGINAAVQDHERELFLKAVQDMPAVQPAFKKMPFTVSDLVPIPQFLEKMKKKDKKKVIKADADIKATSGTNPEPCCGKNENRIIKNENEEFLCAINNTIPLKGKGREVAPQVQHRGRSIDMEKDFEDLLERNLEFSLLYSKEYMEGKVSGLDELIMGRLRAGAMSPEAHLDMHGLNTVQAYESLSYFLRDAWFKGLRVVLLVPGRGLNSPNGIGVLRQNLQTWLTQEPFKRIVLAFCTAQSYDGGPGSIYVLLRKYRKRGRIYWDRFPADPDLF